jgi:hypothetical protein
VVHDSILGEVAAFPLPVTRPRLASNGNIQACTLSDSLANAILRPSGDSEISLIKFVPVVIRSIEVACSVCGLTFILQMFLAPRSVRSK